VAYSFAGLARFLYKQLFRSRGTAYRLTLKRLGLVAMVGSLYGLVQIMTWTGFLLDEILYPGYRKTEIEEPVYIVGNPRSGTTFLQRLMARDQATFLSMRTWEMLLAPSVTMRKVFWAISSLDSHIGRPLARLLGMLEEGWQEDNVVHRIALRAPEEDEYLLIHIFSTLKIWLYVAMLDEAERYTYFDSQMPEEEKDRIMAFYTRCLQRHAYAHGKGGRHYLAKNPHFSPMVDTLYREFPGARIIYLARNPLDMIPSYVSLKENEWQLLGDPVEDYSSRKYILDMAHHWYTYPLERIERAPRDQAIVIDFSDLVTDARGVVQDIYERFGLELSVEFDEILIQATRRARQHESEHDYSLEEMGLNREQIVTDYRQVFERFGFDTRAPEQPAGKASEATDVAAEPAGR